MDLRPVHEGGPCGCILESGVQGYFAAAAGIFRELYFLTGAGNGRYNDREYVNVFFHRIPSRLFQILITISLVRARDLDCNLAPGALASCRGRDDGIPWAHSLHQTVLD